MDNPGPFSLGDFTLAGAGQQPADPVPVTGLAGMVSLGLFARFAFGALPPGVTGAQVEAYIQTSFDQGQTWFDIACFAFAAAGGIQVANISADALVAPTAPQQLGLAAGTVADGLLGDQLQAVVVVTGGYTNATLLSLWGVAR